MKLWKYIREKMMEHPEQIVCEENCAMTYEELCIFAETFGKKLTAPMYGVLCNSELGTAMGILASIAAGKTVVPMASRYGKEAYSKILDRADPPYVIHDGDGELDVMYMEPKKAPLFVDTAPAVILFTSGSTGEPKGVMLSDENLILNVEGISSYFPIDSSDTILISRPLYHSSVLTGEFLVSLCKGAKIVFSSEAFQPLNLLRLIRKHQVTVFGSTPTLLSVLARFVRSSDQDSVRMLSISGECMTEGMAKSIRKSFPYAEIYCGYGLSEASPRVAYLPPDLFDMCPTAAGIPLPSVKLKIVDDMGKEINDSEVGELLVSGPNIMIGYFDDAERTEKVLKGGWLHTGDLACWGKDELPYIKGRRDDMIIRAGMNIYPAEIENALSDDERVESVTVCGYHENGTQQIYLSISGTFSNQSEVMELCHAKLPSYQMPSKIELRDKTEVLKGGKKKRRRT